MVDFVHNFQVFWVFFWGDLLDKKKMAMSWSEFLYSWVFFCEIFSLLSYGRFCFLQLLTVLNLEKNLVGFIAKYAVDANLFLLGS